MEAINVTSINTLLSEAKKRAVENNLPYAGVLTPQEAYQLLQYNPNAQLVDVRTRAELELVGRIPTATVIEWAFYPGMVANPDFVAQLNAQIAKDAVVIFMCRTGGRSHNAAVVAQQHGFEYVYNMIEGFEGETNAAKQRTLINGWKHAGLPWTNA